MDRRGMLFAGIIGVLVVAMVVFVRPGDRSGGEPVVVATIHPIADAVRAVVGDRYRVETLLPPGASPHTFEPTTLQLQTIGEADVVFRVGLDLERWIDPLIVSAGASHVVTLSEGLELIPFGETTAADDRADAHDDDHDRHHGEHAHEHGRYNPHVWLDPVRMRAMVGRMADAMAERDPEHAAAYRSNAGAYQAELDALDAELRTSLGSLKNTSFVVFHDAYAYLADRYGVNIVGVIEQSPGKEPGAGYMQHLIELIRSTGVAAVIVEPQFSPKIAEAIAHDAGVQVIVVDPVGDPDDPARATYIDLMRFNMNQLVDAGGGE